MHADVAAMWSSVDMQDYRSLTRRDMIRVMQELGPARTKSAVCEVLNIWANALPDRFCEALPYITLVSREIQITHTMVNESTENIIIDVIVQRSMNVDQRILWYLSMHSSALAHRLNMHAPPSLDMRVYRRVMHQLGYTCADGMDFTYFCGTTLQVNTDVDYFFSSSDELAASLRRALMHERVHIAGTGTQIYAPVNTLQVLHQVCDKMPRRSFMLYNKTERIRRHVAMHEYDDTLSCHVQDLRCLYDHEILKMKFIHTDPHRRLDREVVRDSIFSMPGHVRAHVASVVNDITYKYLYGGAISALERLRLGNVFHLHTTVPIIEHELEDINAARAVSDGVIIYVICRASTHHYFRAMHARGLLHDCYVTAELLRYRSDVAYHKPIDATALLAISHEQD